MNFGRNYRSCHSTPIEIQSHYCDLTVVKLTISTDSRLENKKMQSVPFDLFFDKNDPETNVPFLFIFTNPLIFSLVIVGLLR